MNYKLETYGGESFNNVSLKALCVSFEKNLIVEFDFNGITCLVDKNSNLENIWRDYLNAHTMKWKVIGPDCADFYSEDVQQELDRRNEENAEKQRIQEAEWDRKEQLEKEVFNSKVRSIVIELSDAEAWNEYKTLNTDPYGACCVEYADGWARLMQVEISNGKTIVECAESTSHELGFLGITGFMYGCAVSMLSRCWEYGEDLRKWHNKEYGHEGDGVVNPAILTIQSQE